MRTIIESVGPGDPQISATFILEKDEEARMDFEGGSVSKIAAVAQESGRLACNSSAHCELQVTACRTDEEELQQIDINCAAYDLRCTTNAPAVARAFDAVFEALDTARLKDIPTNDTSTLQ